MVVLQLLLDHSFACLSAPNILHPELSHKRALQPPLAARLPRPCPMKASGRLELINTTIILSHLSHILATSATSLVPAGPVECMLRVSLDCLKSVPILSLPVLHSPIDQSDVLSPQDCPTPQAESSRPTAKHLDYLATVATRFATFTANQAFTSKGILHHAVNIRPLE